MTNYSILIIEDDEAIGQSLKDGFAQFGFDSYLSTTGTDGLHYLQKHNPHLIVLDVRLPDGSGFDFCRKIRGNGFVLPIIILTAQQDQMDKILGLEIGADDYITKPFSMEVLLARMNAIIIHLTISKFRIEIIRINNVTILNNTIDYMLA